MKKSTQKIMASIFSLLFFIGVIENQAAERANKFNGELTPQNKQLVADSIHYRYSAIAANQYLALIATINKDTESSSEGYSRVEVWGLPRGGALNKPAKNWNSNDNNWNKKKYNIKPSKKFIVVWNNTVDIAMNDKYVVVAFGGLHCRVGII